jgi:hypothetical protein
LDPLCPESSSGCLLATEMIFVQKMVHSMFFIYLKLKEDKIFDSHTHKKAISLPFQPKEIAQPI